MNDFSQLYELVYNAPQLLFSSRFNSPT